MKQPEAKTFKFHEIMSAYKTGEMTAEQATTAYQNFSTIDAFRPMAFNGLGLLSMKENRFSDAIGWLSQAIALAPEEPTYHHNLAIQFLFYGNFDDAEYHDMRALRLRPNYAEAYYNCSQARKYKAGDEMVKMLEG